ncbi:unnamed protein product [Notodromas monacha]|uniref:ELMO domain-containing protein n=1 Tax=Notodromas monacha TaxID=399045 RepID=A0A7R9BJC9_9CRUS|nr:unnamed protein product [Notodromas monacha]CAG0915186.1 unnamed protein product [Notodromas monacha]
MPEDGDTGKEKEAFENAKDEWENVQTLEVNVARKIKDAVISEDTSRQSGTTLLTFDELWRHVEGCNLHGVPEGWHTESNVRNAAVGVRKICFPCAWMRKLWPTPPLRDDLVKEKDLISNLRQFENENEFHVRALKTIYKRLVGGLVDPPRFGSHWEDIGFQGTDPATDLRGVGFLSLVNAVYLVASEPKMLKLAQDVHRLSNDSKQNFPFMVLCINVTRIALIALKEGLVNQLCNEKGSVIGVVNELYASVLFHIYWRWKTEGRTIADSSPILQGVRLKRIAKEDLEP